MCFAVRTLGQDYCMESCFGAKPVMYGDVFCGKLGGCRDGGSGWGVLQMGQMAQCRALESVLVGPPVSDCRLHWFVGFAWVVAGTECLLDERWGKGRGG